LYVFLIISVPLISSDPIFNNATLGFCSGNIDLNNFLVIDHKKDTLIYFNSLNLSPRSLQKMISSDLNFKSIKFDGLQLNIVKYISEDKTNLEIFLDKLNKNKKPVKIGGELNFEIQDMQQLLHIFLYAKWKWLL